jgi:hypothetical protein
MDWTHLITTFIGSAVVASVISGITTFVSANRRAQADQKLAQMRGEIERDLAALKSQFDNELAVQKAQLDNRAMYAAERVAHELLMHPAWEQRSFEAIHHRLGGFQNDELRRILVQAGAVRFTAGGNEYWGLIERNREALTR